MTKSKMLASRYWAFPLCGGALPYWVLGWVDWSSHEMGVIDSLGDHLPPWAKKDLCAAAAGLEYWLKHNKRPDIKSLKSRFTDWSFKYHDFSHICHDGLQAVKSSTLKAIQDVSRQNPITALPLSLGDPSSLSGGTTGHLGSQAFRNLEVQKITEIIFNAKHLVIFCDSLHTTHGSQVQMYLCLQFSLVQLQMIHLDYYDQLFGRSGGNNDKGTKGEGTVKKAWVFALF
ncbi:hypothetical protein EDD22DRAFT_849093 [Suillus occidentalis]|nr:hypothetical protein EDD22DRAFT_849093 [Suillus occidentalis]